jgi:peptidoglycan/xylan/chitin deacetylase (PgdA/CDA1 family)
MEITKEKRPSGRLRFLWLLLIVNIVLIASLWQYHRLIVEVSDGAAADLYRHVLSPFKRNAAAGIRPLKVAVLRSEATAVSFGENKAGYESLIALWRRLLENENFGYEVVSSVPAGEEAEPFNLLVLPASRCLGHQDREAVKAFLRAGKGVLMTWATGTRNEFGQWEQYSLLHEVGGMEVTGPPPATRQNMSSVMVSGGYPITANLYPGFRLNITAFDQPVSCHVREDRTLVDGVWANPEDPTFELHSVRDRAAVAHGSYGEGRFVWTGFTIGSGQNLQEQREAFFTLFRSAMLWAGHQVQAFKPVWPDARPGVLSITQDVFGPEDVSTGIIELARKHRIPLTSFVRPSVLARHPEALASLLAVGEIGLLGDPAADYAGRSLAAQQKEFETDVELIESLTGRPVIGFRLSGGQAFNDRTQDALVRVGFRYISLRDMDRMVPKATRSYRPIPLVTRPRMLWEVPETPYLRSGQPSVDVENTMPVHLAQIIALGGLYGLSFTPSTLDGDFPRRLELLIETAKKQQVPILAVEDIVKFWEGWDSVRIATRYISPQRTTLKISNTWTDTVKDIIVNIEMPSVQRRLDLESMTLGTELPTGISNSGVRWRLHLGKLGGGKNLVYYINVKPPPPAGRGGAGVDHDRRPSDALGEVW